MRHGWNIEVEMPGDLVSPQMQLQPEGTGTAWDQVYDVDCVEFEFQAGEDGGFSMRIDGKTPGEGRSDPE